MGRREGNGTACRIAALRRKEQAIEQNDMKAVGWGGSRPVGSIKFPVNSETSAGKKEMVLRHLYYIFTPARCVYVDGNRKL
jgi:hypothetical protein